MAELHYCGIGSRRTPPATLALMEGIAARQARDGWVLRSGGSPGADQAFTAGALAAGGRVELYLPWPGFERAAQTALRGERPARAGEAEQMRVLPRPAPAAYDIAERFHPRWRSLTGRERALLARDVHEVLGAELDCAAELVVCWTADASLDGAGLFDDGTGQALRVACASGVRVLNLARPDHAAAVR